MIDQIRDTPGWFIWPSRSEHVTEYWDKYLTQKDRRYVGNGPLSTFELDLMAGSRQRGYRIPEAVIREFCKARGLGQLDTKDVINDLKRWPAGKFDLSIVISAEIDRLAAETRTP